MLARLAFVPLLGAAQVPAPPDVAVEWVAPPECPDRAGVLAAISRRLGRPLATDEAVVTAHVARVGPRAFTLRLRLSAGTRGETREVRDPSCAALADVVALLVAAAVDPATVDRPEPEATESETPPAAAPGPDEPPPSAAPPAPIAAPALEAAAPAPLSDVSSARSSRPGGFVRLHGGPELGAVPGVTGAVGLAGGLLWRRWRLEAQALAVLPRSRPHELAQVRVGLYTGAVHGCRRLGRGAIEVPLCLGVEAGAMRGEARGWPSGQPAFQAWLAGVIGAGVAWHATARWSLWGAAQLVLSPVHPRFVLGDSAHEVELWKPAPASGRLLLGVEFRPGDPW